MSKSIHTEGGQTLLVGLTGGIGCGKSTVLKLFRQLGTETISADEVVHHLLKESKTKQRIRKSFGDKVFDQAGEVDRAELAKRIFSSKSERKALESILHPLVFDRVLQKHRQMAGEILIAEIPLLFETGKENLFDKIIVVKAPIHVIKKRLKKRGMTDKDIEARLKSQLDIKRKLEKADYVIDNSLDLKKTERQVKDILADIRSGSKGKI